MRAEKRARNQSGNSPMHIRDWPVSERPREKLLARGATALSDAELLAIFLGSGLRGRDAVATSRELLAAHGPLRVMLDLPARELATLPGLGPARACALAAALELGHRHLHAELERGESMGDQQTAALYFARRLRGLPQEVFAVLFLDNRHRMIAFEEMFRGTLNGAEVHPREVVRRALTLNAASLVVGHNHPSGNPQPSQADREVTRLLKEALALVDLQLLDHFVIGDGPPVSMAARGWL